MPNDFYTPTGNPADNSNIVSADMRAEFAAINAGFNKLPTLTGNANELVVINSSGTGMDVTTAPTGLTSINKVAITQPANGATFTLLDGKTLTVNNTLTLAGTDGTVMTFPATNATLARTDAANTFTGIQDFDGRIDANAGIAVTGANFTSRGITDSATAKALTLSGSGANSVTIANSATNPTIGTSAGGLQFSPDDNYIRLGDGTQGNGIAISANLGGQTPLVASLILGSNRSNGNSEANILYNTSGLTPGLEIGGWDGATYSPQFKINHTASANRYITLTGSAGGNPTIETSAGALALLGNSQTNLGTAGTAGYVAVSSSGDNSFIGAAGGATDSTLIIYGSGAGGIFLRTGVSKTQVLISHVADADRYITLSGANAANPKISTSAGSLDIGAAVVFTGQTVGTTVGAAGGASAPPATPLGYLTTSVNGSACKIPYYN